MAHPQDLNATLYFLSRDSIYSTVKPYILNYLSKTIPSTNYKAQKVENVPVSDLRFHEDQFTFSKNGFAVLEISSKMSYEDFANEDKILNIYFKEVANAVLQYTQGLSVHIFDFLVRRRDHSWPSGKVNAAATDQPAIRAHIDTSIKAAHAMAEMFKAFNMTEGSREQSKRWIYLNIWKPLNGPLHDWPLALCDAESTDEGDVLANDSVSIGRDAQENMLVHYNPKQRWYYLSNQLPSELLVFRQADSDSRQGVPHASFDNPLPAPQNTAVRESIEVRAIIFLDK